MYVRAYSYTLAIRYFYLDVIFFRIKFESQMTDNKVSNIKDTNSFSFSFVRSTTYFLIHFSIFFFYFSLLLFLLLFFLRRIYDQIGHFSDQHDEKSRHFSVWKNGVFFFVGIVWQVMLGTSSFVVPTVRYVCQINGANRKHHIDFFLVQNAAVSISKAKT